MINFKASKSFQRLWSIKASSDSSSKAPKNSHHKSSKIKNIQRTHEKQEISNKHIVRDLLQFHSKDLSIHFAINVEDILCLSEDYIDKILELKTFLRRSN